MMLEKIKARSKIIKLIRRFFDERGFLEMHTPRLVGLPGQEPHLDPFWTKVSTEYRVPSTEDRHGTPYAVRGTSYAEFPAALITSPEYMMKRLLAEGLDKIYDLGPCFRNNEPWDGTHDPEFLLLEWYRRDAGLEDLMRDTEEMIRFVASEYCTGYCVPDTKLACWQGEYRVTNKVFERITVEEAWRKYAGIELAPLLDNREDMAKACLDRGQTVNPDDTWDDLYFKIFLSEIEPRLGIEVPSTGNRVPGTEYRVPGTTDAVRSTQYAVPTFLYRYPACTAALARRCADDQRWAERVELYIGDLELANGFAELSDPIEQRKRFEEEQVLRQKLGKKIWDLDEKFLSALPNMGDAAGIAFGVDRLVMLLTGTKSINDILPASAEERLNPLQNR